MAKLTIKVLISLDDGSEKESEIIMENVSEVVNTSFGLEYVCASEGGPLVHPNAPPSW